ncbi:serine hydrolase domain-containing protein [Corynebacterium timonense]|uniref:CubicO group peptidase, beta-lactamase class C family n=1 Tax=Corynebacterium timonense TaxID=441500 RepID=A0A1H1Q1D1_9CORY|nr:serine hydrolase domain-containing protein [Corynebacterium timonense]SDS17057.1 CubicO group peptidase, beta-lactamase class C family [Corynebacterium timonense]
MTTAHRLIGVAVGIAVLAVFLLLGPRPVSLSEERTGDEQIAAILRDNAERGHRTLTAFVYDNGEVTYGGLGADEYTEVEIGSATKTFNAELVRQQIEEGALSLETTVGELIDVPGAPVADVRIEELLNHTSGLDSMEGLGTGELLLANLREGGNPYRDDTPEDILAAAAEASVEGRGDRSYSNFGHALLGQLLARNAGTTYEELVRTRIFEPAGMTQTYLATPAATADDPARGVGSSGRRAEPWVMDGWAPAGAIRSTAADMAAYAAWVAEHGRPDYAWSVYDAEGAAYPYHNGGTGGYRTMFVWDPDDEARAAFVVNSSPADTEDLGVALLTSTKEAQ